VITTRPPGRATRTSSCIAASISGEEDAVDRHHRVEAGFGEGELLQVGLAEVGSGQPLPGYGE
jgi:hypothetical protein